MVSKIKEIEQREGRPIKDVLVSLFDKHGRKAAVQAAVAEELEVNQSTVSLWLLRLGLEQKTVLVEREPVT